MARPVPATVPGRIQIGGRVGHRFSSTLGRGTHGRADGGWVPAAVAG